MTLHFGRRTWLVFQRLVGRLGRSVLVNSYSGLYFCISNIVALLYGSHYFVEGGGGGGGLKKGQKEQKEQDSGSEMTK